MRRILKEQATTQDPTLSLILSDCGWKGYQLGINKNNGKPALIQSVAGKGVVYLYNDFTFEALSAEGKVNNSGSYSACEAVKGKIQAPLGPDQEKFIAELISQNKGFKKLNDAGVKEGLGTGTYKQVDLNSLRAELFKTPNVHFMYQSTAVSNQFIDQMPVVKKFFEDLGYKLEEPEYGTPEYDTGVDALSILNNNGGASLVAEFTATLQKNGKPAKGLKVWKSTTQAQKGEVKKSAENFRAILQSQKIGRKECQVAIKDLYTAASQNLPPKAGAKATESLKDYVYKCATQGTNYLKGVFGVQDEIEFLKRNNGPYGLRYKYEQRVNESKDNVLKSIIKNRLTMLSESKKKTLVSENKIIQARFNVITESSKIKTETVSVLFNESFDLVNLGLSPKLISEGLWDSLKGMFGLGTEGILGYFKEKIVETILSKLGISPDSWVAGTLVKAIGNIPIGDYTSGKILTCDYLTPLLAKSIAEEALDKVKDKAGLTGGFYDVLRNSIVQGLDSSDFAQSIERGLASVICPSLSKISGNMDGVFDKMKTKALS